MPNLLVLGVRKPGRDTSSIGGVKVPVGDRQRLDLGAVLDVEHPAFHAALVDLARDRGALVHEIAGGGNGVDRAFVRDTTHAVGDTAFHASFACEHRKPELDGLDTLVIDEPGTYVGIRCVYQKVVRLNGTSTFEGGNSFQLSAPSGQPPKDYWFIGIGERGNHEGLRQIEPHLKGIVSRRNSKRPIELVPVETDELHITSVMTPIGPSTVLLNPDFADPTPFTRRGLTVVEVPEADRRSRIDPNRGSLAGNVFWLPHPKRGKDGIISHEGYAATNAMLAELGYEVRGVPLYHVTEHLEGGPDCLVLKLNSRIPLDCWD